MMTTTGSFPSADAASSGGPAAAKTSRLAIASLICSVILCCPITTILGVLLGFVAFLRIRADAALRGGAIAVVAMLIGIVATAGQGWGYATLKANIIEPMLTGPKDALAAGFGGDIAAFRESFHGAGAAASDEEATAFLDELRARYGAFVDSEFNQQSQPQGGPVMEFDYLLHFANDTVSAKAQIIYGDENARGWLKKLGFIAVSDGDRGDLVYPPGLDISATRGRVP